MVNDSERQRAFRPVTETAAEPAGNGIRLSHSAVERSDNKTTSCEAPPAAETGDNHLPRLHSPAESAGLSREESVLPAVRSSSSSSGEGPNRIPEEKSPSAESARGEIDRAELCADIVDGILQASHRLRGILADYFAEFGLSDVRFAVLRILQEAEPEACTQARLSQLLNQSESSISTLIKRMRNSGLLYRLRSIEDKRKRVLKLTASGREHLRNVQRQHGERMARLLSGLETDEQRQLEMLLRKLRDLLSSAEVSGEHAVVEVTGGVPELAGFSAIAFPPPAGSAGKGGSADPISFRGHPDSANLRKHPGGERSEKWDQQNSAA